MLSTGSLHTTEEVSMRVLFLCTENTARSQMAEAILRHITRGRVEVVSGGSVPGAEIHRMARQAIRTLLHVEMENQWPKHFNRFVGEPFDYVITVCDRIAENCPVFGDAEPIHWGLEDPAAVHGSDEEQQRAFDSVARQIAARIRIWMCLPAVRDAIEQSPIAPETGPS
jgi:protein-tyrosine-phosphatase